MPVYSFSAGQAPIPDEVLSRAQQGLLARSAGGLCGLEQPFTGAAFRQVMELAESGLREALEIPGHYRVLFVQGGASAQFSLVPLNLLGAAGRADYIETGYWSRKAHIEAQRYGRIRVAASSAGTQFDRVPEAPRWTLDPDAAYCHITENETAEGVQYPFTPDTGAVPLVADMSSSLLSRPVDISRYGLIYASTQKNIGPAGLALIIVREDLLDRAVAITPAVFNYGQQAKSHSMLNTPPTPVVHLLALAVEWLRSQGGVAVMAQASQRRSGRLYAAIDNSRGLYSCRVQRACRSRMNVCFHLPDERLTEMFIRRAEQAGLLHLRGHRMHGGIRASLYNTLPEAAVDRLVDVMDDFARSHA